MSVLMPETGCLDIPASPTGAVTLAVPRQPGFFSRRRLLGGLAGFAAGMAGVLGAVGPAEALAKPSIVVVGDSISLGAEPDSQTGSYVATGGYAVRLARDTGSRVANFACAGATSTSAYYGGDCLTIGPKSYGGTSQVGAAERYIKGHARDVSEVIVELGTNDGANASNIPRLEANMTLIAKGLRKAAGHQKGIKFIGLEPYDPALALYLKGDPKSQAAAESSVALLNSTLTTPLTTVFMRTHYKAVSMGEAFGNNIPFSTTVPMSGSLVPMAVANICEDTFMCSNINSDLHTTRKGDDRIAQALEASG